ncbi:MAG: hypothetical protein IJB59_01430 [Oscillospiraceae bacterium]|nr:hypothetical protein [Oscillospiraceae bacterium]
MNTIQPAERKYTELLIFFVCILIMIPIGLVAIYDRPAADDYEYAYLGHMALKNGGSFLDALKSAWDTVVKYYVTWQGTYTSAFFMALQPGIWGERHYAFSPMILLGMSYFGLFFSVHIFNKHFFHYSGLFTLSVSFAFLTFFFQWLPYPRDGLFWYNGGMHYTPWFFLTLLNIALLLEAGKSLPKKSGYLALICSVALSFILSGVNQSSAFFNILCVLSLCVYWFFRKRRFPLLPLVSACIGFMVMFLAPGNAVRQEHFVRQGVFDTVFATLKYVFPMMSQWINFEWFISLIFITPLIILFALKNKLVITKWGLLISFTASFTILCGMLCVPYMAMAFFGPERLLNAVWFSFIFFSWINYGLLWCWLIHNKVIDLNRLCGASHYAHGCTVLVILCLCVLFLLPSSTKRSTSMIACQELSQGIPQQHAVEMDWRTSVYHNDEMEEAVVYPITVTSQLISHADVFGDPTLYPNISIGNYYGKPVYLNPLFVPK